MLEFILVLIIIVLIAVGAALGSINKVVGPRGKIVKDDMTANWLKEIDVPEETMSSAEFIRVKRSYKSSNSSRVAIATLCITFAVVLTAIGWSSVFSVIHDVLLVIAFIIMIVVLLVNFNRNRKVFDTERENFTKKKAILVNTDSTTYLNSHSARRVTGNVTGQTYSMTIGVCNSKGVPKIYTIPVPGYLYAMAVKIEKFDVIMYKGEFSALLAFKTQEEADEEAEAKE